MSTLQLHFLKPDLRLIFVCKITQVNYWYFIKVKKITAWDTRPEELKGREWYRQSELDLLYNEHPPEVNKRDK